MKILVFDDSPVNRESASLSLADHDLTVVGSYDEAQKALTPVKDNVLYEKVLASLLEKAGLAPGFYPVTKILMGGRQELTSEQENEKYYAAEAEAEEKATTYPDFNVVLTDLMVPASAQACAGSELVGTEMPLGTTIALLALAVGIKTVAVVTDMCHHKHPASAAFDRFRWLRAKKSSGINVTCTNQVWKIGIDEATGEVVSRRFLDSEDGKKKYPYVADYSRREGLRQGKDWGVVLKQLLGEKIDP